MQTKATDYLHLVLTIDVYISKFVTEVRIIDIRNNDSGSDKTFEFYNGIIFHKSTHCFIDVKQVRRSIADAVTNAKTISSVYKKLTANLKSIGNEWLSNKMQLNNVELTESVLLEIIQKIDEQFGDSENSYMATLKIIEQDEEKTNMENMILTALENKWAD